MDVYVNGQTEDKENRTICIPSLIKKKCLGKSIQLMNDFRNLFFKQLYFNR